MYREKKKKKNIGKFNFYRKCGNTSQKIEEMKKWGNWRKPVHQHHVVIEDDKKKRGGGRKKKKFKLIFLFS